MEYVLSEHLVARPACLESSLSVMAFYMEREEIAAGWNEPKLILAQSFHLVPMLKLVIIYIYFLHLNTNMFSVTHFLGVCINVFECLFQLILDGP